jgi:2-dehydropantoate 2-reductase
MRIALVGVGGVGGYFGGKLAREYENSDQHEIVFIARGEHLKAIQKNGLQLFTREGDYIVRPQIVTDNPAEAGVFDLVFFCTKSYSLESSAQKFSACINKNTVVIPLLNGVNNADRLCAALSQTNVLNACVYIISFIETPGSVRQTEGPCLLTFGTDDETAKKYQYILDILLQAKIRATLTSKISEVLWAKYMLICPLGSLTSLTCKTYGEIMGDMKLRQKLKNMMKEVIAVARARKVILAEDSVDKAMELIGRVAYDNKTSMQLDREKGRQTEIDLIPAYICRMGRELGIPTPLHNEIYAQLK